MPGKKQSSSRISTLTGLSRKEVARLEALPPKQDLLDASSINRAARVFSGWVRQSDRKNPADLAFEGGINSFTIFVKHYCDEFTARSIAFGTFYLCTLFNTLTIS